MDSEDTDIRLFQQCVHHMCVLSVDSEGVSLRPKKDIVRP